MRRIEIVEDVHLRFPARDEQFDLGIEIGAICALMARGEPLIQRTLSTESVEQLRPLAERFRYALVASPCVDGSLQTSFVHWSSRPQLRIVR